MITKKLFLLLFFSAAITLSITETPQAQSIMGFSVEDLSTLNPADISDNQLRMFIARAQQEGISVEEAFQMAQMRGLPTSVATQLRMRIQQLQASGDTAIDPDSMSFGQPSELDRIFSRPSREETETMSRTFGAHIFRQQETEFVPTQNVPTPVNYVLGPGDELVIHIWGDQTNVYRVPVTGEGTVVIDNLGPVMVSGMTIKEASDAISEELKNLYSGMDTSRGEQTTFSRVSLERLRSIQVAVIGEAVNPGDYAVPSFSTVYHVLYRAGGPDENGSYRRIRVIRNNNVVAEMDLYRFLVDGIQEGNIQLRDGDVVQIPTYEKRVEVQGEVKRNGLLFEMLDGESVEDLIHFAGGFSDRAYTRQLRIHRTTPTERRIESISSEEFRDMELRSGDVLFIDEILDRFENRITITGAVWRSGEYELKEGMTLSELIREAEGIRPDAFLSRGLINRLQDDYSLEQLSFDVSGVLNHPDEHDIVLKREDHIRIRSIHEMAEEQTVQIKGAVRSSGTYYYRNDMTLEDLILQAEGFTDAASEARIEISRRISGDGDPESSSDEIAEIYSLGITRDLQLQEEDRMFRLKPFDIIYVHRKPDYQVQRIVRVEGEVKYPGLYTLNTRTERVSDIIRRAGGLTTEAYEQGARLIRQHDAIDRPEIELDFLAGDEVVDDMLFAPLPGDARDDSRLAEDETTAVQEQEESEQSIEQRRAELNRQNLRPAETDSVNQNSEEMALRSRRISIDLPYILSNPGSSDDLYLRDGDVIRIPKELQTVAINGAVMQNVEVRYREGAGMSYYIDSAGGFTTNAQKGRIYVVYPNGDVDRKKRYLFGLINNSPPIEPGTQIIIPAKPERARLTTGEIVSISAAVVGMSTSLMIAIDRLRQ